MTNTNHPVTRRNFLKTAAGAAAALTAPSIIPASAWGKGATPPPSERINLAHIGVGGQGSGLLRGFVQLEDVQYVAVCDCFKSRREQWSSFIEQAYATRYGQGNYKGVTRYADFRELLARPDVDAVVISTPDHWHVPVGLHAARAGKDMYIEKPLGISIELDQAMREAVRRYKSVFQYGTQQRSSQYFRHACELVRNGRIGKVRTIQAWCAGGISGGSLAPIPVPEDLDYEMWLGPAPARPYTADRCINLGTYHCADNALGFIAGWGAHPLDIAQWGLGTDQTGPVRYEGTGEFPTQPGLFNTATNWDVNCTYANGIKMRFMSTNVAKPLVEKYRVMRDHGTTFFGDEGWISVDRGGYFASNPAILKSVIRPDEIHLGTWNYHGRNFIDCVKSRALPLCHIECAVRSDTISHLSDIAIRLQRPIQWDPVKEVILGDEEASRMTRRALRAPWHII